MHHLLTIDTLTPGDVTDLFQLARRLRQDDQRRFSGRSAIYSFEGNSLRTRATFLKALSDLNITAIELPNLLKTAEPKRHLAGYLDQWCDLYIVRDANHTAIEELAYASQRPVINAMSASAHPCEVLGDAFFLQEHFGELERLKFCLVGPPTNVLNSWRSLCEVLHLPYVWAAPPDSQLADGIPQVHDLAEGLSGAHVVLTDSWPAGFADRRYQVTRQSLAVTAPGALLIPCPPFNTTQEISAEVIASPYFAGYSQKRDLYLIQKAILVAVLSL